MHTDRHGWGELVVLFCAGEAEGFVHPVVGFEDGAALAEGLALGFVLGDAEEFFVEGVVGAGGAGAGGGACSAAEARGVLEDEFIVEGDEGLGGAGVALAAGAAEELAVDAAGFVAFGGDDVQAAEFGDAAAEFDVGAAAGHVGGDGDFSFAAGHGDDLGLLGVADGVEHLMLKAEGGQHLAEFFGVLHAAGADEDGLAGGVEALDFGDDGGVLGVFGGIDGVGVLDAAVLFVGRNEHDGEVVDLPEFAAGFFAGTGHAAELFVGTEKALKTDPGEGVFRRIDGDLFLGFHGLMQPFTPGTVGHQAASELVDDDDFHFFFVAGDDVLFAAEVELTGLEGLRDQLFRAASAVPEAAMMFGEFHDTLEAGVGELDFAVAGVDGVVFGADEAGGDVGGLLEGFDLFVVGGVAGDDEGGDGFIDEDGVGFVDDGEGEAAHDDAVSALFVEHFAEEGGGRSLSRPSARRSRRKSAQTSLLVQ